LFYRTRETPVLRLSIVALRKRHSFLSPEADGQRERGDGVEPKDRRDLCRK
jgi:hypothetical protein